MGEKSRVSFGMRCVSFASANLAFTVPAYVGVRFLEAKEASGKISLQPQRQNFLLVGFLSLNVTGREFRGETRYHPSEYRESIPSEQEQGRARLLNGLVLLQPAV